MSLDNKLLSFSISTNNTHSARRASTSDHLQRTLNEIQGANIFLTLNSSLEVNKELLGKSATLLEIAVTDFIKNVASEETNLDKPIFERYSIEIQRLNSQKDALQTLRKTTAEIKEQFPEIGKEIDEIQKKINTQQISLDERIYHTTIEAFKRFYSLVLDSRPDLDPHLTGGSLSQELRYMALDLHCFIGTHLDELDHHHQRTLFACIEQLDFAFSASLDHELNGIQKTTKEILTRIGQLKPGRSCLIPGGAEGHSFVYRITRIGNSTYSFTIINTGQDESYLKTLSRAKILGSNWTKGFSGIRYTDKSYIVHISAFNEQFINSLLESSSANISTGKTLAFIDVTLTKQRTTRVSEGRAHHPQGRGSCSLKCITSWLKGELMETLGEAEGRALYEKFRAYRTKQECSAIAEVGRSAGTQILCKVYNEPKANNLDRKLEIMRNAAASVQVRRNQKAGRIAHQATGYGNLV